MNLIVRKIVEIIRFIRYRFFLFAGIFPYLLGQSVGFNTQKSFNWHNFYWGFLGVFFILAGVEFFNEYFDARSGGDRVFVIERPPIRKDFYLLGILASVLAFFIGVYLACLNGWLILLFSLLGFLGAYFYVGPPFRWAYRGLGEAVISLSYGPLMVLGSYYLQTRRMTSLPLYVSLICGLSVFCLAVLNEIPDYYQDRLVGKRNLVVRIGKQKAIKFLRMSSAGVFLLLALGVILSKIPAIAMINFLLLPWLLKGFSIIEKNYEDPMMFRSVINANLSSYLVIIVSLSIGYLTAEMGSFLAL